MCPSAERKLAEAEAEEADALAESGDTDAALAKLADAVATDPANDDARYDYVKLLIGETPALDPRSAGRAPVAHSQGRCASRPWCTWMDRL
jgi:putative thioredoxin